MKAFFRAYRKNEDCDRPRLPNPANRGGGYKIWSIWSHRFQIIIVGLVHKYT